MHIFWLAFLPAAAYQVLAIVAAVRQLLRRLRKRQPVFLPPVSVLKPLRGLDPGMRAALVSQLDQQNVSFEVLFGSHESTDPAVAEAIRLEHEFPTASVRVFAGAPRVPNGKAGILAELSKHALFPIRVVNDSDIKVDPDYLASVTAPLADAHVGVVTCLYRAKPRNLMGVWEALGIMTDFMPSTMVAQLIGVREFGLGSTLAFRAADLEAVGGFLAFADYIADDYQLAKRITGLGKRVELSTYVVETSIGEPSWLGVWRHQLRWARTIRLSKGGGYVGLPLTHAGLWAILAFASGAWVPGIALLLLRTLSALLGGGAVLKSSWAACLCWLSPLWDLYSFAVWLASYCGRKVVWRDCALTLGPEGRIDGSGTC